MSDKRLPDTMDNEEGDTFWARREPGSKPADAVESVRGYYGLGQEESPSDDAVSAVFMRPTKPGEEEYDEKDWAAVWCDEDHPEAEAFWEVDLDA